MRTRVDYPAGIKELDSDSSFLVSLMPLRFLTEK